MTHTDEGAGIQVPADSITILDLLLRAGLCAPHMWDHALGSLSEIERAETRDALTQGALPLPQLIWEWGVTIGEIDPLQPGSQTIQLADFYESLNELSKAFGIQISVPIAGDVHDNVRLMPPFRGQRLHLVNRGDWMNFGPPPEDIAELTDGFDETSLQSFRSSQIRRFRLGKGALARYGSDSTQRCSES